MWSAETEIITHMYILCAQNTLKEVWALILSADWMHVKGLHEQQLNSSVFFQKEKVEMFLWILSSYRRRECVSGILADFFRLRDGWRENGGMLESNEGDWSVTSVPFWCFI